MLKNITNLHNGTKKKSKPFFGLFKKIHEIFKVKPPKSTGLKFGAKYLNNFFCVLLIYFTVIFSV